MKSGFLSIIGPANAGKSTLLNSLLKSPLNIVSARPQTTRNNVAGILTDKERDIQLILMDTPGILKKNKSLLDEQLQEAVLRAINETDIVLFVLPANDSLTNYSVLLQGLQNKEVLLVLNKSDLKTHELTDEEKQFGYKSISISALKKENLEQLLDEITPLLKDENQYYPDDVLSDRTERFFAKEYVREAILKNIKDEIPHQVFVDVEEMVDKDDIYYIKSFIYLERENHKSIVIGKGGKMIKKIGSFARERLEELLGKKVYLELKVKVHAKWRQDLTFLKRLEYY